MEWQFTDFGPAEKAGRGFDCQRCKAEVAKRRKCDTDEWDHPAGGAFPIKMSQQGGEYGFCPGKLFRDDPSFVAEMRDLWLAWQMGQVPDGTNLDSMDEEQAAKLTALIRAWTTHERAEDFRRLGMMLGGGSSGGGST